MTRLFCCTLSAIVILSPIVSPAQCSAQLPAKVSKSPISFDRFIRNVMQARYSDYRKLPGAEVDSEAEFNKMRAYILNYYKGHIPVRSLASDFNKDFGWSYYDCFPVESQPSAARQIGTPDFPEKHVPFFVVPSIANGATRIGTSDVPDKHVPIRSSEGCSEGCAPVQRLSLEGMVGCRKLEWCFSKYPGGCGGVPGPAWRLDMYSGAKRTSFPEQNDDYTQPDSH